jgi:hypothetical protein
MVAPPRNLIKDGLHMSEAASSTDELKKKSNEYLPLVYSMIIDYDHHRQRSTPEIGSYYATS